MNPTVEPNRLSTFRRQSAYPVLNKTPDKNPLTLSMVLKDNKTQKFAKKTGQSLDLFQVKATKVKRLNESNNELNDYYQALLKCFGTDMTKGVNLNQIQKNTTDKNIKILDELRRLLAIQQEIHKNAEANLMGVKGFYNSMMKEFDKNNINLKDETKEINLTESRVQKPKKALTDKRLSLSTTQVVLKKGISLDNPNFVAFQPKQEKKAKDKVETKPYVKPEKIKNSKAIQHSKTLNGKPAVKAHGFKKSLTINEIKKENHRKNGHPLELENSEIMEEILETDTITGYKSRKTSANHKSKDKQGNFKLPNFIGHIKIHNDYPKNGHHNLDSPNSFLGMPEYAYALLDSGKELTETGRTKLNGKKHNQGFENSFKVTFGQDKKPPKLNQPFNQPSNRNFQSNVSRDGNGIFKMADLKKKKKENKGKTLTEIKELLVQNFQLQSELSDDQDSIDSNMNESLMEELDEEINNNSDKLTNFEKKKRNYKPIKISFIIGISESMAILHGGHQIKKDRIYKNFRINAIEWHFKNSALCGMRLGFYNKELDVPLIGHFHGVKGDNLVFTEFQEDEVFSKIEFATNKAELLYIRLTTNDKNHRIELGISKEEAKLRDLEMITRYFPKEVMLFNFFCKFNSISRRIENIRFLYVRTILN